MVPGQGVTFGGHRMWICLSRVRTSTATPYPGSITNCTTRISPRDSILTCMPASRTQSSRKTWIGRELYCTANHNPPCNFTSVCPLTSSGFNPQTHAVVASSFCFSVNVSKSSRRGFLLTLPTTCSFSCLLLLSLT